MEAELERRERYRGALVGLAAGDALGTTLEFARPGTFEPVSTISGGGLFDLKPGQWTDDTSMAMCLAESLIECGGFDARDQMRRYLRWFREGYWSSTGKCFDIGRTTLAALARFEETGEAFCGSNDPLSAGNGCLMRLAPVALYYAGDYAEAQKFAGESSRTTHGARTCIDACRFYATLIAGALNGARKEELLARDWWRWGGVCAEVAAVIAGSYKGKTPPEVKGIGHVVECFEAALWAFFRSEDYRTGALMAVNLGDDSDTTGAVFGQLAGAYYGEGGIPLEWREILWRGEEIGALGERLMEKKDTA